MWPFKKETWPTLSLDEIKKRARILVIDDSDFYYLPLFKKDGYNVEKWDDVNDLPKLESGYYDIILLDIQGVAKEQSQEQGLGILKHLNQVCPTQVVIAYSNADFSLKYQEFFKLADATLAKSNDYVDFKRAVDKLLQERFSLGFYVGRIVRIAGPYVRDTEKLREVATEALQKRSDKHLRAYLDDYIDKKDTVALVLQVIQVALAISSL